MDTRIEELKKKLRALEENTTTEEREEIQNELNTLIVAINQDLEHYLERMEQLKSVT